MIELKRKEHKKLQVKVGEDILEVDLNRGLATYQKYLHFRSLLEQMSIKMQQGLELTNETIEYFTELIKSLLACVFAETDIKKVMAFYENDPQEVAEGVIPFLMDDYLKAIKELKAERAEEKLNEYIRLSDSRRQ